MACAALVLRDGNPVQGALRLFGNMTAMFYLACWMLLLIQTLMLGRPFTGIIDTFLLPLLLAIAVPAMTQQQRHLLARVMHSLILLNIAIGFYEYAAGRHIIPLVLNNVVMTSEWRATALLGHPLIASGLVAGYTLTVTLNPRIVPNPLIRLPLIATGLAALMVFGGRTALITTLSMIALASLFSVARLARGARVSLPALMAIILIIFAGATLVVAALSLGTFDKMLLRFSSDKGSTLARYATWHLLSHFQWPEILFGPSVTRANALQSQLGLDFGIENFWISSIVQFGLVHTAIITAALGALLARLIRRSEATVWALVVLIVVIAMSSVSFSSKNIQLAQFIALITVLLPRETVTMRATRRATPHVMMHRGPPGAIA
jgi:hypothetical protein